MNNEFTWRGVPLSELTKDTLIDIIVSLLEEKKREEIERERRRIMLNAPYY